MERTALRVSRCVSAALVLCLALSFGAFMLAGCSSNYPEGVDTDASEVRSVTMSGNNYEVVDYEDRMFELPKASTKVYELADSRREFMSRDEKTLWIKGSTADRLGLEGLEVLGDPAEEDAE